MIYQVTDTKENKVIYHGNDERVIAEMLSTTPLNVMSASQKQSIVKRRYLIKKMLKRKVHIGKDYMVCDTEDDELVVFIGTMQEVSAWIGGSRTSFYSAVSGKSKAKGRYLIYEIEDM